MGEPFIGEIRMFAGNFPPNGWAFCIGQLIPISENDALFNLIGTTYGGDGTSHAGRGGVWWALRTRGMVSVGGMRRCYRSRRVEGALPGAQGKAAQRSMSRPDF